MQNKGVTNVKSSISAAISIFLMGAVGLFAGSVFDTKLLSDYTTDSITHVWWDVDTSLDDNTAPTPDTLGGTACEFVQGRIMEWLWAYSIASDSDSDTVVIELQYRPEIHYHDYVFAWTSLITDSSADSGATGTAVFSCDSLVCPIEWRTKVSYWDYSDTGRDAGSADTNYLFFGSRLTVKE